MAYVEVDIDVSYFDFEDIVQDIEDRLQRKKLKTKEIQSLKKLLELLPSDEETIESSNVQLIHLMKMEVIDENIDRFSYEEICKMFER